MIATFPIFCGYRIKIYFHIQSKNTPAGFPGSMEGKFEETDGST